jgi:hypothetical protein
MGVTIQFESHRVELPFIYELEHNSKVFEYYDQPPSIPLVYRAVNGRRLSVMHTPDYFVLREGSASWIECKAEEDLDALASRNPNRYSRDIGGKWRCIPGEEHAATVGLAYEVWSAAQVNWVLQRNLQFLEDYLRFGSANTSDLANPAIIAAIETKPGITLLNLLESTRGVAEPDEIYMLISSGTIYVDLNVAPVAEPERVHVFATAEMAAACEVINREACGDRYPQYRRAALRIARCTQRGISAPCCGQRTGSRNCESPLRYCQATSRRGQAVVWHAGQNIASLDGSVSVCPGALRFWLFGAAPEDQQEG